MSLVVDPQLGEFRQQRIQVALDVVGLLDPLDDNLEGSEKSWSSGKLSVTSVNEGPTTQPFKKTKFQRLKAKLLLMH